jgi:hypothetical protein
MTEINYHERYELLERYLTWKQIGVQSAMRTAGKLVFVVTDDYGDFWYLPGGTPDEVLEDILGCVTKWASAVKDNWEGTDTPDESNAAFVYQCVDEEMMDSIDHQEFFDYIDENYWGEIWLDYKEWLKNREQS